MDLREMKEVSNLEYCVRKECLDTFQKLPLYILAYRVTFLKVK
jgi:hypothetical protein